MNCNTVIVVASLLAATAVQADVTGFPIPGWRVNQDDAAPPSPVNPPESITLTTTSAGQSRSAFFVDRQPITAFEADFTYTFTGTADSRMGAAFVLHNRPAGPSAVARAFASGVATNIGYSDTFGAFNGASVAISLELGYTGSDSSSSGVYTGGAFGGPGRSTSPVSFASGNPIDVQIRYNGFLLSVSAMDSVTGDLYDAPLVALDLGTVLGGESAFVGFTGSTNNNSGTTQTFSDFRYRVVPSPASALLVVAVGAGSVIRRRR